MMSSVWHKKRLSFTIYMNCFDIGIPDIPFGLVYGCFDLSPYLLRISFGHSRVSFEESSTEEWRRYRATKEREAVG